MMLNYWFQKTIELPSRPQGCYLITEEILKAVGAEIKKMEVGLCSLMLLHEDAGLVLGENCDPTVRSDMQNFFNKLVPDKEDLYSSKKGSEVSAAYTRSAITGCSMTIPIQKGTLMLGTWQGIWVMEFMRGSQQRKIAITLNGEVVKWKDLKSLIL